MPDIDLDEFDPTGATAVGLDAVDMARHLFFGFTIVPAGALDCPLPVVDWFFRIDEFAYQTRGYLDVRDQVRFICFGFDVQPIMVCTNLTIYVAAPGVSVAIVLDSDLLSEIQYALVEDVDAGQSMASGLWTVGEVIGYLNQRVAEFLKLAGVVVQRVQVPMVTQVQRHNLPEDWIVTARAAFRRPNGVIRSLHRVDHFSVDLARDQWNHVATSYPDSYTDYDVPSRTIETFPQTQDTGELEVLYVGSGVELGNAGTALPLPSEFAPAVKWGVIANMLGKVGRAHDEERAQYAEMRFREGVEAANMIQEGWGP